TVIDKMHSELVKLIRSPESIERLASVGAIPVANTPAEFAEYLRQDVAKWAKVVKEHGIKAD
ncbi:MAG: tripartite tricarboxylate transporter substrate binding protein, partial [Deltaproteobacteria bacterium]|nr:tripartite tricarboxylate transporter substrate binding protein [Deltaproteobacteria bacterium]